MSNLAKSFAEGFGDSFVLAFAIVAAVVGGAYRMLSRMGKAYAQHEPLEVGPGHRINLP